MSKTITVTWSIEYIDRLANGVMATADPDSAAWSLAAYTRDASRDLAAATARITALEAALREIRSAEPVGPAPARYSRLVTRIKNIAREALGDTAARTARSAT